MSIQEEIIGDDGLPPSHRSPVSVGDEVNIVGMLCASNSSGGTEILKHDGIQCRVTKVMWDYETGWRYHGTPVDPAGLELVRTQTQSQYDPDWYRQNRPDDAEGLARAVAALEKYDPSKVYFSEFDLEPLASFKL